MWCCVGVPFIKKLFEFFKGRRGANSFKFWVVQKSYDDLARGFDHHFLEKIQILTVVNGSNA